MHIWVSTHTQRGRVKVGVSMTDLERQLGAITVGVLLPTRLGFAQRVCRGHRMKCRIDALVGCRGVAGEGFLRAAFLARLERGVSASDRYCIEAKPNIVDMKSQDSPISARFMAPLRRGVCSYRLHRSTTAKRVSSSSQQDLEHASRGGSATLGARSIGRAAACAGALAALLTSTEARAQCQYDVTIIEGPKCPIFGYAPINPLGLNELGQIAGMHWQCSNWPDEEAFFWGPESGIVDLPRLPGFDAGRAYDLNERGQVVGRLWMNGQIVAALWDDGQANLLGELPGARPFSEAAAINNLGQIVGYSGTPDYGPPAAVLWQDGKIIHLGLGAEGSTANDINDAGQIVGCYDGRAYIWQDGVLTDVGVVPGGLYGEAEAVSADGKKVAGEGLVMLPDGTFTIRSFLWDDGEMTHLGEPPPGDDSVRARGVNSRGQVVGHFQWSLRGFIWQNGAFSMLNDLIVTDLDVEVFDANGINEAGQIAASGGFEHNLVALLLTPMPAPGDVDGDCVVGMRDLLDLLASWGPCGKRPGLCHADLNGDGVVGLDDLQAVLEHWD